MSNTPSPDHSQEISESTERHRQKTTTVIGDLDGDIRTFREALRNSGCIFIDRGESGREAWKWTGGKRDLILLGDILADRCQTSFEVLQRIHELRPQIIAAGGNTHVLVGNHDMVALRILLDLDLDNDFSRLGEIGHHSGSHYQGLDEFWAYGDIDDSGMGKTKHLVLRPEQIKKAWQQAQKNKNIPPNESVTDDSHTLDEEEVRARSLRSKRIEKMKENMREDPSGHGEVILEEIQNMQLLHISVPTLMLHTPMTKQMLDYIFAAYNTRQNQDDTILSTLQRINDDFCDLLQQGIKGGLAPIPKRRLASYVLSFLRNWNGRATVPEMQNDMQRAREASPNIATLNCETPKDHPVYILLREAGITNVVHGHVVEGSRDTPPAILPHTNLNRNFATIGSGSSKMIARAHSNIRMIIDFIF